MIIGSGWIGMEVAATARELGNEVTILARDAVPLAAALGPGLGEVFRTLHEEHGVDVRTSAGVERITGDFEQRAVAYRQADYMTVAEKRQRENLPFIDGTDRIIINASSIPLDEIDQGPAMVRSAPSTASLPPDTVRTLMGRLGRHKTIGDVDASALVAGLNGETPTVLAALDQAVVDDASLPEFRERLQALEVT